MCLALPTMFWQDPLSLIFRVGLHLQHLIRAVRILGQLPAWVVGTSRELLCRTTLGVDELPGVLHARHHLHGLADAKGQSQLAQSRSPRARLASRSRPMFVLDGLIEPIFCVFGLYSFPGAIRWAHGVFRNLLSIPDERTGVPRPLLDTVCLPPLLPRR